jgi:hypothetical protein
MLERYPAGPAQEYAAPEGIVLLADNFKVSGSQKNVFELAVMGCNAESTTMITVSGSLIHVLLYARTIYIPACLCSTG